MMRLSLSATLAAFCALLSGSLHAQQSPWLKAATYDDWGSDWARVSPTSYLDLGSSDEALGKLSKAPFVVDSGVSGRSSLLKCGSGETRYLIRSLYFGNLNATVYRGAHGLIVAAGSFSQPESPSKGAIAICLHKAPKSVFSSAGFAK